MNNLTPKQIVEELDKYIIGQAAAKKAVAVALRNRYRRSRLSKDVSDDITPKNIILRGATGVGKTEIARRLAKLVRAPFIKVEATKYTEVGYVGRDIESMIRDLVEVTVRMVKDEKLHAVEERVNPIVENLIVDKIVSYRRSHNIDCDRNVVLEEFRAGKLNREEIEIEAVVSPKPIDLNAGMAEINLGNMFEGMFPGRRKKRKVTVKEAVEVIRAEESDKLIDLDSVNEEAIFRAENDGIIFIDEMDKVIGKHANSSGPDVSREGVQRDLLPIVEGSTVATKYGNVKTDYILFIAAGAFHMSKIEEMIPELQGRFPIRVDLDSLTKKDFISILSQPKNAITFQYTSLLEVDNIKLNFTDDALDEIAELAETENETTENIGARRLHTVMERLLEDVSFNATGEHPMTEIKIDRMFVQTVFKEGAKKTDLKKYIL